MIALAPMTATTSGFEPCSIAGRMNRVSTSEADGQRDQRHDPAHPPHQTTASAKIPASSTIGNLRFTSVTEYCRSRGASGAYATTTSWPWLQLPGGPAGRSR